MNAALLIAAVLLGQAPAFKPGDHVVMNDEFEGHGVATETARFSELFARASIAKNEEALTLLDREGCLISIPNGTQGVIATKPIVYRSIESKTGNPVTCHGVRFGRRQVLYVLTEDLMTTKQRAEWRANQARQLEAKKQATEQKAKEKLKDAKIRKSPLP